MEVKLNFINTTRHSDLIIVFFQKNKDDFGGNPIAWKVLKNTANGWGTPFDFSTGYHVAVQNEDGAPTPQLAAKAGDKFIVEKQGDSMKLLSAGGSPNGSTISILNDLPDQTINALVYKNEDIIAKLDGGPSGRTASFDLGTGLWVGVCEDLEIKQGETLPSGTVASINTQLSLLGVKSADIVMKEVSQGGHGAYDADKVAFEFSLENIQMV